MVTYDSMVPSPFYIVYNYTLIFFSLCRYNLNSREDIDGIATSNPHTSAVDLSRDYHAEEVESQQQMWEFEPDSYRLFNPDVLENEPIASLIEQHHLTYAMNAEAEAEEMEGELSQES